MSSDHSDPTDEQQTPTPETEPTSQPTGELPSVASEAASVETPSVKIPSPDPDAGFGKRGIKIGSKRNAPAKKKPELQPKPQPVETTIEAKKPKEKLTFPPPRLERDLPPEMQQELEDSFLNVSLDDMINKTDSDRHVLEPESRVSGTVQKLFREDVFIDLGGRNQGIVPLKQFDEPPEVGTQLEVIVQRFLSEDGLYEIVVPGASVKVSDWSEITEGLIIEVLISGHNKGGLECEIHNIRGFIPAGQVSLYRIEDFSEFVGQKLTCVVTEANKQKRNLVLSHRAVLEREQAEKKEKLLAELEVGQSRDGIVRKLTDFGAFVDLGGVDGLIHISQLSWDRIRHPNEVLTEGQKVGVKIQKIDLANGRIGLAYRDLSESPWTQVESKYTVTAVVPGTVSRIADFGAFVKLEPGIEGLIHISELSHGRVFRVADVLSEGQEVQAKILSVDAEAQRISLSLKAMTAAPLPVSKKNSSESEQNEAEEAESETPIPIQDPANLKGGLTNRHSQGDQFGLKW